MFIRSLFTKNLLTILSTPSSVWWRQIYSIYGTALTKVNRKLYTCKQPNGLKCPILQSDGWYKWAILRNKTDSEAMRDKQSNDTMLGGLSFLMWITGSDKGNNGMTKGWQDYAIKDPEAKTEIVSHSPNLLRMGSEEKVWKNISQDVCLFKQPKDQHRKYVDTKSERKMQMLIFLQWMICQDLNTFFMSSWGSLLTAYSPYFSTPVGKTIWIF